MVVRVSVPKQAVPVEVLGGKWVQVSASSFVLHHITASREHLNSANLCQNPALQSTGHDRRSPPSKMLAAALSEGSTAVFGQ